MKSITTLRCTSCGAKFSWSGEPPDFCPNCGSGAHNDERPGIQSPAVRKSALAKSADQVYRALEDSSAMRAEAAASQFNLPIEEMSSLKITNLKDNLRQGDIAAITPSNEVSQMIETNKNMFGMQSNIEQVQQAMQYASAAHTGPDAYAGTKAQNMIRQAHSQNGAPTTDAPSVEITQRNAMMANVTNMRRR